MTRKVDKDTALNVAFTHAAFLGDKEVIELAVEAGIDLHFNCDVALRAAAEGGQTDIVDYLLRHGADVHAKNDDALRLAKKNHHKETAKVLRQWMKFPSAPS